MRGRTIGVKDRSFFFEEKKKHLPPPRPMSRNTLAHPPLCSRFPAYVPVSLGWLDTNLLHACRSDTHSLATRFLVFKQIFNLYVLDMVRLTEVLYPVSFFYFRNTI